MGRPRVQDRRNPNLHSHAARRPECDDGGLGRCLILSNGSFLRQRTGPPWVGMAVDVPPTCRRGVGKATPGAGGGCAKASLDYKAQSTPSRPHRGRRSVHPVFCAACLLAGCRRRARGVKLGYLAGQMHSVQYGVTVSVFNQAVKRNIQRFPADFAFQLTREEHETLRSQIVISRTERRGGR